MEKCKMQNAKYRNTTPPFGHPSWGGEWQNANDKMQNSAKDMI